MQAGIYFHIPFCKQACHYCDFHFVTSQRYKAEMLEAMQKELTLHKQYAFLPQRSNQIGTVYFGGGTPSVLAGEDIQLLLERAHDLYDLSAVGEITLEANPDDLSAAKLQSFRQAAVNRFSIGVQSFFDEDLKWMNRAHQAQEAESAIKRAQDAGFDNITLDLIYGYPLLSDEKWQHNIEQALALQVPHISAYSMTVEPRTALGTKVRKGQEVPMDEDQSARQFNRLMDTLEDAGFEHYEISNWAKPGRQAVHNSRYWKGHPYLGIGPSAHAYNGSQRQWNVSNNAIYIREVTAGGAFFEQETLTGRDRVNEYLMTALRTANGVDLAWIQEEFGAAFIADLREGLTSFEHDGLVERMDERYRLTRAGKLLADRLASELFVV